MMQHLPAWLVIVLLLAGCDLSHSRTTQKVSDSGQVLRIDGDSIVLGEASSPPMSIARFVSRVHQLLIHNDNKAVKHLVHTHADLAEQAVLSHHVALQIQQVLATWLDAMAQPLPGGWSLFVSERADKVDLYRGYYKQRDVAWAQVRRGDFGRAARRQLKAAHQGPTPWLIIDAYQLQATALLATARPAQAAEVFTLIADQASDWDARVAARAHLFAALSYQLAGDQAAARDHRAQAEKKLTVDQINDPLLLHLLIKTTPTDPAELQQWSERSLRARLGRLELTRGSGQAALLAWRIAETKSGSVPSTAQLRLWQAEALIALGQDEPAMATLIGIAQGAVRPQALTMLGLIQLRRGQIAVAETVLREAISGTTAQAHPDVYADAGFALLCLGQAEEALPLLDQAHSVYVDHGNQQAIERLAGNRLRYAQAQGDLNAPQ